MFFLKDNMKKIFIKINTVGFIYLSIAVGSLQIFLDRGELEDWFSSNFMILLFFLTFITLIFFIFNSLNSKNPLFPRQLFKDRFYVGSIFFLFYLVLY